MYKYAIDGNIYTIKELSDIHGIHPDTLRYRLRKGYTIEESIKDIPTMTSIAEFCEASTWTDWLNQTIDDVYSIYWQWCVIHAQTPTTKVAFGRYIKRLYPIKTVPNRRGRIIRRVTQ